MGSIKEDVLDRAVDLAEKLRLVEKREMEILVARINDPTSYSFEELKEAGSVRLAAMEEYHSLLLVSFVDNA